MEDNQMSFVGLQLNQKERKVIAFADSKGSRIDEKGNYFFDKFHAQTSDRQSRSGSENR